MVKTGKIPACSSKGNQNYGNRSRFMLVLCNRLFPDIIILDARAIDREYVVPATPGS